MPMRRWLPLALACLACVPALAQERSYAIVSLVGDGLLIVQREMSTGSSIDRKPPRGDDARQPRCSTTRWCSPSTTACTRPTAR
jgi:hypothetical protein